MELARNIRRRRLQRLGLVMRMKEERVPKETLKGYIEGRRPDGRPQEMFTCSGQRHKEDIEMHELEKVGRG